MKQTLISILLLIFVFISPSAMAKRDYLTQITPENFDSYHTEITTRYNKLISTLSPDLIRRFKNSKGKNLNRLSKKQASYKKEYFDLVEQKKQIDPLYRLREDLIDLYTAHYKNTDFDRASLQTEATVLTVGLFNEIRRLKKSYRSIFIPIVHNMMIDVGVRKRGACKHWAEDLLAYLRTVNRGFFYVVWGEANMQKITEHNVAVIIPMGRPFKDGLIVDPWRTSGRPFWIKVTADTHYPWQQWTGYGAYY
ncbi:MAG: hypothetical protein HQM16_00425 [Deltaproteobacteria bacterium]|nr:hypothetical protein [Deltaproteobacteria bacterium]